MKTNNTKSNRRHAATPRLATLQPEPNLPKRGNLPANYSRLNELIRVFWTVPELARRWGVRQGTVLRVLQKFGAPSFKFEFTKVTCYLLRDVKFFEEIASDPEYPKTAGERRIAKMCTRLIAAMSAVNPPMCAARVDERDRSGASRNPSADQYPETTGKLTGAEAVTTARPSAP